MIDTIFSEFVEQTPVTVMVRGIMERIFEPKALNRLFETYAVKVISKKDHTHLHRSNSEYGCCLVGIMIAGNHLSNIRENYYFLML